MEVYINDELINFKECFLRDFYKDFQDVVKRTKNTSIEFNSIKMLNGDKELLEMCFQHEKKELLNG